jgi:Tol biopolymer transport system component
MNADGTGKRQVTSEPHYMGEPQWFPNSSRLVFDGDKPDRNILVSNLDGSGLQVINDQPGEQRSPSVSLDGQFIYYDSSENGVFQIYRMDADGSNQTALTTPAQGSNRLPKLSRDGNHITFVSDRDGNDEIYPHHQHHRRRDLAFLGCGCATPDRHHRLCVRPRWQPRNLPHECQ